LNAEIRASVLNVARLTLTLYFTGASFPRSVSCLQVVSQAHVQGNRNAHYDQRTATQDQEPPDHPHNRLG
jgi:hypothetical protein